MHITRRLQCVIPLLLLAAGTSITATLLALVTMDDRWHVAESFDVALSRAVGEYRERVGLQQSRRQAEATVAEAAPQLKIIEANKRTLRRRAARLLHNLSIVERRYSVSRADPPAIERRLRETREELERTLRRSYLLLRGDRGIDTLLFGVGSLTEREGADTRVRTAQMQTIGDLEAALTAIREMPTLRQEYGELLTYSLSLRERHKEAVKIVQRTNAKMLEIQRILTDVHDQVLKLQAELSRIDARLRSRAERALIEKGLLPPKSERPGQRIVLTPDFVWPVSGPISAGFHDDAYEEAFGVPHEGMDIAVDENTLVRSAADGVVFLVRDGGETGYTYVLLGHRGGYATLYGHLLSVAVRAGQEVSAGQVLGLSGGRPGTPGSGPLTSGAHLHFEVIRHAMNIDPTTVLP